MHLLADPVDTSFYQDRTQHPAARNTPTWGDKSFLQVAQNVSGYKTISNLTKKSEIVNMKQNWKY